MSTYGATICGIRGFEAGVSLHVLQQIAGHADSRTTECYFHPDRQQVTGAGDMLSKHLRYRPGPALRVVG